MVRPRPRPGRGEQTVELYGLWGQAALSRIDENEPETFLVDCVLPTVACGMLQFEPVLACSSVTFMDALGDLSWLQRRWQLRR